MTQVHFYRFTENAYYALIAAESQQVAIDTYKQTINDTDADYFPKEVSANEALQELYEAGADSIQSIPIANMFQQILAHETPEVLVIDADLL